MGKWKEGWHPTSRVKYPKPRSMKLYYNCGECYIWQFNKVDLYCYLLELRADVLSEERRLKEKYEQRSLYS